MLSTIRRIKRKHFWRLFKLCIPNMHFLWTTFKATKECMRIATEHFDRKHYRNGPANAFRHALWNVLIAKKSFRAHHNIEKTLIWTKQITDWHEIAFFSKELPMKMDFHNNAVGRTMYRKNQKWQQEQFLTQLLGLTEKAVKIDKNTNLNPLKNQLVYIADDY